MRISIVLAVLFLSACGSTETSNNSNLNTSGDAGIEKSSDDAGAEEPDSSAPVIEPYLRNPIFEPGEYNVGYGSFEHTYDAIGESGRTIRIAIWYPTRDEEGGHARYAGLINRPEAIDGATIAADGPYPVLVFSHGNGGMAEQSYYMTEFFATHGFVVASADHTGNTFREAQNGITLDSAVFRPQDVSAMIDAIQTVPSSHVLFGQITDQIAMSGHSFGGYTTLATMGAEFNVDGMLALCAGGQVDPVVCAAFTGTQEQAFRDGFYDPRVLIGLPQAPAGSIIFAQGLSKITAPIQLWTAGRDATLPNFQEGNPIWNLLTGAKHYRVDINNAGHFTYSNMCELFGFIEQVANDGCSETFLPYEDAFPIINAYSLAFIRKHFAETDIYDELLDGTARPYEAGLTISAK